MKGARARRARCCWFSVTSTSKLSLERSDSSTVFRAFRNNSETCRVSSTDSRYSGSSRLARESVLGLSLAGESALSAASLCRCLFVNRICGLSKASKTVPKESYDVHSRVSSTVQPSVTRFLYIQWPQEKMYMYFFFECGPTPKND